MKIIQHPALLFGIPSFGLMTCVFPPCYPFTILQSLALQGLMFLVVYTLVLILFRKMMAFAFSFLCCLGIGVWILPHLPDAEKAKHTSISEFTVAQFNVDFRDGNYQNMIHAALETHADLIAFQEVSEAWEYELIQGLRQIYPFYVVHSEYNRGNGIAVFAKKEFQSLGEIRAEKTPFILGGISHEKGDIFFMVAHAKSPVEYHDYVLQKQQFHFLTKIYQPLPAHYRFLIGDLNAVPWSEPLKSFLENTDLQDSRYELLTTFPRKYAWAGIPIDYILHSPQVQCIALEKITSVGSDHAGLLGKYVFHKYQKQPAEGRHSAFWEAY